jgi:hypothetical protein
MHPAYSKDDELPRSAAICRDLIINELKQGDSSEKHMHHLFDILETTYGHSASDYIVSATKAFDVRFVRVLLSRPNPPDLVSREKAFLAAAEAGCPEIAKLLNSDDLRPGIHTKALILALRMSGSESGAPPAYSDIE